MRHIYECQWSNRGTDHLHWSAGHPSLVLVRICHSLVITAHVLSTTQQQTSLTVEIQRHCSKTPGTEHKIYNYLKMNRVI